MTAHPTRRQFLTAALGLGAAAVLPGPAALAAGSATVAAQAPDVALSWMQTTYDLVLLENLSPPAAARTYAYTAIGMYEAVVSGMPAHRSLAGQVTGLATPPPRVAADRLDWPAALVTSAAAVLRQVLPFAGTTTRTVLDAAESAALSARRSAGVSDRVLAASTAHGRLVAANLGRWMARDGHAGTVGRAYTPPTGEPWLWESTPPNHRPAIEPHWSEVRPLVLRQADEVAPEPPVPFSAEPGSTFHEQAMAPYRQSRANTDEQRAIARFWTDNPGSFTPPLGTPTGLPSGHWMLIAAQALALRGVGLDTAVETLATTGIALHDAFLNCWTWKYRYNLLRPVTYIRRYVDPTWTTYINTPQFPEHSSGHSVASPAAAAVLTSRLGTFPFTDHSHAARGHTPRTFASFTDAAHEAARSRLYGGIHYPHAIAAGLVQGEQVGALVLERVHTRRLAHHPDRPDRAGPVPVPRHRAVRPFEEEGPRVPSPPVPIARRRHHRRGPVRRRSSDTGPGRRHVLRQVLRHDRHRQLAGGRRPPPGGQRAGERALRRPVRRGPRERPGVGVRHGVRRRVRW